MSTNARTTRTRRAVLAAASVAASVGLVLTAMPSANAAEVVATTPQVIAAEVVAQDASAAQAPEAMNVPRAVASKPRTITVSNHKGKSVVLFGKGEKIRRNLAPGSKPVTFTGLTAGKVYTVAVGGEPIGTVVALNAPQAAAGLKVSTTDTPGTVQLEWQHKQTKATGGADTEYVVTASSPTAEDITTTVVGQRTVELSGLDPQALYSFSVTPRNTAGAGKATRANMTRTLSQLTGTPTKTESTPTAPAPKPTESTPAPAPTPGPAPAPRPSGPTTKTIWVCPDGYSEVAGQCQTTKAYTFHDETETRAYTYTWTKVGSHQEPNPGACNYLPDPSSPSGFHIECPPPITVDDYANVKDATPSGFTDNGSAWVKTTRVKDAAPAGYADNGTEWVKTAAKVERVVPA